MLQILMNAPLTMEDAVDSALTILVVTVVLVRGVSALWTAKDVKVTAMSLTSFPSHLFQYLPYKNADFVSVLV